MATYYTTASSQRDVMPAIGVRDALGAYPQGQVLPSNMTMYMHHSPSSATYSDSVLGNYQLQLNCGELPSTGTSQTTSWSQGNLSDLIGSHIKEPPYDMWRDGRNEVPFLQPACGSTAVQSIDKQIDSKCDLLHGSVTEDSQMGSVTEDFQMGLSSQMESLQRGPNLQGQGLLLSLSTQIPPAIPVSLFQYRSPNLGLSSFLNSYPSTSGDGSNGANPSRDGENAQSEQSKNIGYIPPGFPRERHSVIKWETGLNYTHSNKNFGLSSIIPNSKYLKMAQQLLDEVVDVRKALKQEPNKKQIFRFGLNVSKDGDGEPKEDFALPLKTGMFQNSEESNANPATETHANRQDLSNKITKLVSMLEEVDRRYKQYYHQMQIVASYFDGIAGSGASKPYTTLALHTISCHFRCVRDAISGQIKAIRSSLGEEDSAGNTKEGGISRLRFVEQQLRQQRAHQQFGMTQQHAWRPQRGLPETSVTLLRAWLFEHFLHPYPKDSDKIMLARQTGLTRGQVSNWFINARVRLWKPMIEDMYKEEIGDSEMDSNSSSDYSPQAASHTIKFSADTRNINSTTTEKCRSEQLQELKSDFGCNVEVPGHISENCFQDESHGGMKHTIFESNEKENENERFIAASTAYQMAELEMFGSQGGISLTLGLQHFDGSIADATHQNFVTMQGDDRFGASHLLHDFVAQ